MNLDQYSQLYNYIESDELPDEFTDIQKKQLINQARYFEVRHKLLYKKNRKDSDQPFQVIK
jgi:hypothetical protein